MGWGYGRTKYLEGKFGSETEAEAAGREYCYSEVGRVYAASYVGTQQREDGTWAYIYSQSNSCD
jgi:hypothetical protein